MESLSGVLGPKDVEMMIHEEKIKMEMKRVKARLENLSLVKVLNPKVLLKLRFFALRMHKGSSFEEFLNEVVELVLELNNHGEEVSDEDLAIVLISGLHSTNSCLGDFSKSSKEGCAIEEVVKPLSRKCSNEGEVVTRVGAKLNDIKGKSNGEIKNKTLRCWHCKGVDHIRKDCPRRKNARRSEATQGISSQGEANLAIKCNGHVDDLLVKKESFGADQGPSLVLERLHSHKIPSNEHCLIFGSVSLGDFSGCVDNGAELVHEMNGNGSACVIELMSRGGESNRTSFEASDSLDDVFGLESDQDCLGLVCGSWSVPYGVLDEFMETRKHGIKPDPKLGIMVAHGESKGSVNSCTKFDGCVLEKEQADEGHGFSGLGGLVFGLGEALNEGLQADLRARISLVDESSGSELLARNQGLFSKDEGFGLVAADGHDVGDLDVPVSVLGGLEESFGNGLRSGHEKSGRLAHESFSEGGDFAADFVDDSWEMELKLCRF